MHVDISQVLRLTFWHGDQAESKLETFHVRTPDGQVQTLHRIIDASSTAWFSLSQASKVLLGRAAIHPTLYIRCKEGVHRLATGLETALLKEAKALDGTRAPLLATGECLRDALLRMRLP
jgi:hypothetical protein